MTFEEWWKKEHFTPCDFRYGLVKAAWQAATLAEREECAKVCEEVGSEYDDQEVYASWCAKAIRARSKKGE